MSVKFFRIFIFISPSFLNYCINFVIHSLIHLLNKVNNKKINFKKKD